MDSDILIDPMGWKAKLKQEPGSSVRRIGHSIASARRASTITRTLLRTLDEPILLLAGQDNVSHVATTSPASGFRGFHMNPIQIQSALCKCGVGITSTMTFSARKLKITGTKTSAMLFL